MRADSIATTKSHAIEANVEGAAFEKPVIRFSHGPLSAMWAPIA
jgi:hypothetical protein